MTCPFCPAPCCLLVRHEDQEGATCGSRRCRGLAAGQTRYGGTPVRLCQCGCGRRLPKRIDAQWATPGCIPSSARSSWGKRGRRNAIYQARRKLFDGVFADMTRGGRKVTKESILDAFAEVHRTSWHNGYSASESKWRRRQVAIAEQLPRLQSVSRTAPAPNRDAVEAEA
jgi:hypothetical protein